MLDRVGLSRKTGARPARWTGVNHGDKDLLPWPSSWVAGGTGFGPIALGKGTGLSVPATFIKAGTGNLVMMVSPQTYVHLADDIGVEATSVGVDECDRATFT